MAGAVRVMDDGDEQEEDARSLARRIANGHAFRRHVLVRKEYPPITSHEQFAALIYDVITNPDDTRSLPRGRYAYWQEETQTLVITDPGQRDGGTAFRPTTGKAYFDRLD